MMNILQNLSFFFLPLLLALSYFSTGLSNSRGGVPLKPGTPMKISIVFTIVSVIMLMIGYFAGGVASRWVEETGGLFAFVMLMFVGFRIAYQGIRKRTDQRIFDVEQFPVVIALSLALAVDILFAGIAIRFLQFNIYRFAGFMALMVWTLSFSGLLYGNQFKVGVGRWLEIFAGAGLIILAVAIYLGL
jgi:manganese efflux pump family protein